MSLAVPLTWPQRVGMVASNSYIVIVNAERGIREGPKEMRRAYSMFYCAFP